MSVYSIIAHLCMTAPFETKVSRQQMIWGGALTGLAWILSSSERLPGLSALPPIWAEAAAALCVLGILVGVAPDYLRSLLTWEKDPYAIPERFTTIAALLVFFYSLLRWSFSSLAPSSPSPKLHFHTAAFLLMIDLASRHLITGIWQLAAIERAKRVGLTRLMMERICQAQQESNSFVQKTLAVLPYCYGAVLLAAFLTFFIWWIYEGIAGRAIIQMAAVLVITQPWAFLLSIPNSFRISLKTAALQNILVSHPSVLERITRLNAVIFGKRGTLTQGSPHVTDLIPMTGIDEEELLLWAASAEHDSKHPFGQAIVAAAEAQGIPLEPPERFIEVTGRGVKCVIDGQPVRLGKAAFFVEANIPAYIADRLGVLAEEGKTPFICSRGEQYLGIIAVMEELREEAAEVIEKIRKLGLRVILLTGDDQMTSESLSEKLHIDRVISEVVGEQKTQEINKLRREGFEVAMVGNFPEDADTLAESDLGITLTRGKGTELPSTHVILIENKLDHIVNLIRIGHRTLRTARENRSLSLLYHLVALPLAAGVLVPLGFQPLSPIAASLCSVGWLALITLNNRRLAEA